MAIILRDEQANIGRLRNLGTGNPEAPTLRYLEGPRRDLPIAAPPNSLYHCTDTGEAYIYINPMWNSGPLIMRPKRMMWPGIPFHATDVDEVYVWQ